MNQRSSGAIVSTHTGSLALGAAGVLFLLYPVVRPWADETTMAGAEGMASAAWIAAHLFAVGGFVLFILALLGLHTALSGDRTASRAIVTSLLGAGLTLPYYGAEIFGLNVIAGQVVKDGDPALLELADTFRYGTTAVTMFAGGLLLLAVGAVLAAVAVWRSGVLARWSGVPLALGFALFIPQFFGTPAMRIAHGVLMAAGGLWLAVSMRRR
ncbi:hypothetical protein [Streptosporangium sp. KLBMP 9127]|nr:hypothetical protein [Streptosporangium sp. KLBMP 9127]